MKIISTMKSHVEVGWVMRITLSLFFYMRSVLQSIDWKSANSVQRECWTSAERDEERWKKLRQVTSFDLCDFGARSREGEEKKLSYPSDSVIELKGKFHRSYYEIEYRNYGVKLEEHDDDALGSAGKFDGEEKWKVINFLSNWKNGFGFIDEGEIILKRILLLHWAASWAFWVTRDWMSMQKSRRKKGVKLQANKA